LRWVWIALPGAVALVASLLSAEAFLRAAPERYDAYGLGAFALWTLPLAIVVAGLARLLRRTWGDLERLWRALGAVLAGAAVGVAFSFAVYFASGGAIVTFEFPVLYCWVAGAVVGLVAGSLMRTVG
jgi:hypothetical protein